MPHWLSSGPCELARPDPSPSFLAGAGMMYGQTSRDPPNVHVGAEEGERRDAAYIRCKTDWTQTNPTHMCGNSVRTELIWVRTACQHGRSHNASPGRGPGGAHRSPDAGGPYRRRQSNLALSPPGSPASARQLWHRYKAHSSDTDPGMPLGRDGAVLVLSRHQSSRGPGYQVPRKRDGALLGGSHRHCREWWVAGVVYCPPNSLRRAAAPKETCCPGGRVKYLRRHLLQKVMVSNTSTSESESESFS